MANSRDHFSKLWEGARKAQGPYDYQHQGGYREEETKENAKKYDAEKDKKAAYMGQLLRELILEYAKENEISLLGYDEKTGLHNKDKFERPKFNALWEDQDIQSLLTVLARPIPKGDLGTETDYRKKLKEVVFRKCSELDQA